MTAFLISLAVLIAGYFIYGAIVEKAFGSDSGRPTPAYTRCDGVDYMPMPTWKVFLIQFLNIAGIGPIFGAIMGVMFGPASFIWIVLGTIFAGAVHDFLSGMISVRMGGLSLPEIVGSQLGRGVRNVMGVFSVLLLLMVGAVFVTSPAGILAGITPDWMTAELWVFVIFAYYVCATVLPIDKLIGSLYPVFGFALLFMAAGLLCCLLFGGMEIPEGISEGLHSRRSDGYPIFPMMFVSIACGAISGFHATQSPMMARCMKNEKLGRPVFYGAMVAEGIVALIWAAAAIAFTGGYGSLESYMAREGHSAATLVNDISVGWLGAFGGILALLGVVAAPVTTGDTALRSARLIVADFLKISQKNTLRRILVSLPLFAVTFLLIQIDFQVLWRYFAWCNQTLSVFTLWAVSVWMLRNGKNYVIAIVPALFMTVVSVTYLLFAPSPEGFGLPRGIATGAGVAVAALFGGLFYSYRRSMAKSGTIIADENITD
ncbi:MAG: carbon starvation protein A [Muribaculaceae bacterium]|nr:carbon starvation protein A [Muribaculaceae bacterium]